MNIEISSELKNVAPELRLGVVDCTVRVTKRNDTLWERLQERGSQLADELRNSELITVPEIAAARNAYRKLGKDPSRYRGSAEALLRRSIQGKGLYQVNNIVDVNNLISIESRHPVGVYDRERISGAMLFRVGQPGEEYQGIGKQSINLEGLPVFVDDEGPFGSPTADSVKAMIREETKQVRLVVIAFWDDGRLERHLETATRSLVEYADAADVEVKVKA
ncbi:B3/4 domain-containing protein [Myxococcota bacterium]